MTRDEIRDRRTHEADPDAYHTGHGIRGAIDCRWCLGVHVPTVASAREPAEPVVDVDVSGGVL